MTKNDLARSNTLEFFDAFKNALTSKELVVPIADKILLTVKDARGLTGLSEKRIIEAIHAGKLNAKIIGKGWKIKRGDLNDFIDGL
jgi:excisionase family DNA binding protein